MHYCRRDSHATSPTAIYANITQTGRIWVYCSWFWVVLVGFVGFVGGFGSFCWWFWVVLGSFGWFWVVLGGFGWFRVLVTTSPASSQWRSQRWTLCFQCKKWWLKYLTFIEQDVSVIIDSCATCNAWRNFQWSLNKAIHFLRNDRKFYAYASMQITLKAQRKGMLNICSS